MERRHVVRDTFARRVHGEVAVYRFSERPCRDLWMDHSPSGISIRWRVSGTADHIGLQVLRPETLRQRGEGPGGPTGILPGRRRRLDGTLPERSRLLRRRGNLERVAVFDDRHQCSFCVQLFVSIPTNRLQTNRKLPVNDSKLCLTIKQTSTTINVAIL